MIVIDVGSAKYGGDDSIPYLVELFRPRVLYGFDPAGGDMAYDLNGTTVAVSSCAAWVCDGPIGFRKAGLGGHVDLSLPPHDEAINLARFIEGLPAEETVLKMDAEGAEYVLLPHLRERDADLRLKMCWVEWHCEHCGLGGNGRHREGCTGDHDAWLERRARTESLMRCEMHEWNR